MTPVAEALLPEDGEIRYSGTADKLSVALHEMRDSFLLAIAILYLLMSALFRSFKDSLLVLLALPLATVGGVLALRIMNDFTALFQPMDLLTMIGFVILLGLVVNNAILLVHQTRAAERGGLGRKEAVEQGIGLRLRPILMSTLTSIFGMLPLLLIPGAGTELYRGLAAVIIGGMCVSTVFTLVLLPSLLRIGEGAKRNQGVLETPVAGASLSPHLAPDRREIPPLCCNARANPLRGPVRGCSGLMRRRAPLQCVDFQSLANSIKSGKNAVKSPASSV